MDADPWRNDMVKNTLRPRMIHEAPIPIIAAVNGYALAGGPELMICCDLVTAAEAVILGAPRFSSPLTLMPP